MRRARSRSFKVAASPSRPAARTEGTDGQTDGASAGLHADHIPAPGLHPPAVSRVGATCSAISNSTFHPFQQHNRRARLDLVMCRSVWLRRRGDESILPLSHSRPTHSTPPKDGRAIKHNARFVIRTTNLLFTLKAQVKLRERPVSHADSRQVRKVKTGGGAPHKKGNNSCYFRIFIASNSFQNFTGFVQELFFREREKKAVGVKGTSNGFRSVSHTGIPGGCTDLHKTSIRLPSRSLTW